MASFDRGLPQWCVLVNQSVAEVDCEDHVVPPVKFLEPYDSNQSAASLTLHENDVVHVQLTSAVLAHRRQTAKKKDHPNLLPVLEVALRNNELRCIEFGWLRSPISINQESEDNIELLPLYHIPCVTLCTLSLLLSNNTHETTKKKKKKKKKKIVRCQCTTKLTQVSSFSESHTSHGRARHQIRD